MSNGKFKQESYTQLGGLNNKYSPYMLTPLEFLGLINYDFQQPGALSQRWGSTQYIGQTFAGPINYLSEYAKLNGSSYVVAGNSLGQWFGATQTLQGISYSYNGFTQLDGTAMTLVSFGWSQKDFVWLTNSIIAQPRAFYLDGDKNSQAPTFILKTAFGASSGFLSTAVLQNYLFMADGNKFVKFDGITTSHAFMHPVAVGVGAADGAAFSNSGLGATGWYSLYASYVNNRGVEGPIWPIAVLNANITGTSAIGGGGSGIVFTSSFRVEDSWGVSSVNQYTYWQGTSTSIGGSEVWTYPYVFYKNTPISGVTATIATWGSTNATQVADIIANAYAPPSGGNYMALGLSLLYANPNSTGGITSARDSCYIPQYLETYQNRLMLAGFSSTPSVVWFSDIGEPEGYHEDFNFEVRTNDADYITAMKAYSTRLYIFKKNSFHCLTGDGPANFFLQQISDQYGCLNNRCAVIYNDILVFLDRKGVMSYNGSQISYLSLKVQPVFETMNYDVALTQAILSHDKLRNQILIGLPINGSSTNNITIIYDYVANAWTTQLGYNASSFANIQGRNSARMPFYGDYNGRINQFGASYLSDNSTAMTLYFKTSFMHELGESIEKQYRRLYINANTYGTTLNLPINFFQDYGSSTVASMTMTLGIFQNRIDFGIPAKSLAFEMYAVPTVAPLNIFGFTLEQRMQRMV